MEEHPPADMGIAHETFAYDLLFIGRRDRNIRNDPEAEKEAKRQLLHVHLSLLNDARFGKHIVPYPPCGTLSKREP